jgi:hypothetical protein
VPAPVPGSVERGVLVLALSGSCRSAALPGAAIDLGQVVERLEDCVALAEQFLKFARCRFELSTAVNS